MLCDTVAMGEWLMKLRRITVKSCFGSISLRISAQEGTKSLAMLGVTVPLVITGSWHRQHWECWANTHWALGENKLECWANTIWGFGRKNWGFERKQVGVLGENKLGFWAKASLNVGRKQIGVLGQSRLDCWAKIN